MGTVLLSFLGRVCLGFYFIFDAIGKIVDWQGEEQRIVHTLCNWLGYVQNNQIAEEVIQRFLSWAPALTLLFIVLGLVGGILVLLGMKVRVGAIFLFLLMLPIIFIGDPFWFCTGAERQLQLSQFLNDIGLLGGVFLLIAFGSAASGKKQAGGGTGK